MTQEKGIDSLMAEGRTFPPPEQIKANAHISSMEQYQQMWDKSINDPDAFWLEQAKRLHWFKEPTKSLEYTWDTQARKIEHTWFADGQLNVSYNCLDRHLGTPVAKKTAILWQGEAEDAVKEFTYEQLHKEVCKFANVMKAKGIARGDRVAIYLPMVPELAIVMLACTRILVSAPFTRLSSAASAPTRSRGALMTPTARCSLLPTFRCEPASTSGSRTLPTPHSKRPRRSRASLSSRSTKSRAT